MTSEFRKPQIVGNKVFVRDDNIEKAIRKFKKKVNDSGIMQTLKEKEFYQKPTTIRKRAKSAAINRWHKKIADQQLPKKLF
jgi:small subunit ribosomal protein S21